MSDLISRHAAIDAIWNTEQHDLKSTATYNRRLKQLIKIINVVAKLPSAQQNACKYWDDESNFCSLNRPSAQPEPQWIPCSERLPEEQKKVYWICTDSGYQCTCRWTNVNHIWTDLTTDWHWHIGDVPQFSKVVAWMPLPEPWKGEYE